MKIIILAIICGVLSLPVMAQVGKKGEEQPTPGSTPAKRTTPAPARKSRRASTARRTNNAKDEAAETERTFWESIRSSTNPQDFRAYLNTYPNGKFVALARNKISSLEAEARDKAERERQERERQREEEARRAQKEREDRERQTVSGREEAKFITRTIDVSLGPNWIDSGVDLRRGQRIQIKADGTIYAGRTLITPAGLARSTDPNAPLPRAAEGVLIGAIGNDPKSPIIEIGVNREFVADRDGRLYLTVNRSSYRDARGSFNVQVHTEGDPGFR